MFKQAAFKKQVFILISTAIFESSHPSSRVAQLPLEKHVEPRQESANLSGTPPSLLSFLECQSQITSEPWLHENT
jgi:hypothetical protein